jgi:hypothetical protein
VKLTNYLHLVPKLMMGGSIPLRPLYAFVVKEKQFYPCLRTMAKKQYNRKAGYLSLAPLSKMSNVLSSNSNSLADVGLVYAVPWAIFYVTVPLNNNRDSA